MSTITLSPDQATQIGKKIWHNECGGSVEKLTWWKKGEEFASLGIGHFIWFPDNYHGPFTQTFPSLLAFFKEHGIVLPAWLTPQTPCPWKTHAEFCNAFQADAMKELRNLLTTTLELQTTFIIERLIAALPAMIKNLSSQEQKKVKQQFFRVAHSPHGMYALIDYVNFKGEGTNPREQYHGLGWGLSHVLARMQGEEIGAQALQEFADIAKQLLTKRTEHAPADRNEKQWLQGWKNRIDTYIRN